MFAERVLWILRIQLSGSLRIVHFKLEYMTLTFVLAITFKIVLYALAAVDLVRRGRECSGERVDTHVISG